MSGLLVLATLLLAGCASVPMAPTAADRAAKSFQPPPGKASVYIFRPDGFRLSAVIVHVLLNGRELGLMKVGTYLHVVLEPGLYTLLSQSSTPAPVSLPVEPNANYFFQQVVEDAPFWKSFAQTTLIRVDEAQGRAEVDKSQQAATQPPSPPESATVGCSKDTDCKADRVCQAGACVPAVAPASPPAPLPPAP